MSLEKKSEAKMFGGRVQKYTHASEATKTQMTFSVFLPPQAEGGAKVPALYYLSGLTCTDDNFTQKATVAFRAAAARGLMVVAPDTSPRGEGVEEGDSWDIGTGAGFYVDATQAPWDKNYNMYRYVTEELPALVEAELPASTHRSVTGHSMGGHGALVAALRNPDKYCSVSAFAPVCNPCAVPWGKKVSKAMVLSSTIGSEHFSRGLISRGRNHIWGMILIVQFEAINRFYS